MALDFTNISEKLRGMFSGLTTPTGDLGTVQPPANPPGTPSPIPPAQPNTVPRANVLAKFKSTGQTSGTLAETGDIYGRRTGLDALTDSISSGLRRLGTLLGNNSPAGSGAPTYVSEPSAPTGVAFAATPTSTPTPRTTPSVPTATASTTRLSAVPSFNVGRRFDVRKALGSQTISPTQENSVPVASMPGDVVPGTDGRVTQLAGGIAGPEVFSRMEVPAGGGVASDGVNTFFLKGRTPEQSAAAAAPVTSFQSGTPTTTYGDASGVYQLAPGQNPPRDWRSASIGELLSARLNSKLAAQDAQVRTADASIAKSAGEEARANAEMPGKQAETSARTRLSNITADKIATLTPIEARSLLTEAAKKTAETEETKAKTKEIPADAESLRKYRTSLAKAAEAEAEVKRLEAQLGKDPANLALKKQLGEAKLAVETFGTFASIYGKAGEVGASIPGAKPEDVDKKQKSDLEYMAGLLTALRK